MTAASRAGAACGLLFVLLMGVSAFVADLARDVPGLGPDLRADTIARVFEEHRDNLRVSGYVTLLAAFFVLAFGAWLRDVLARGARPRWTADLVLGGAGVLATLLLLQVAFVLAAQETAAYSEAPEIAKTWLVLSWNYANVFAAPALAIVGGATIAARGTRLLPRWLTWLGVALTTGILLLILANMPGGGVALFLLWTLVVSVTLLVRPPQHAAAA